MRLLAASGILSWAALSAAWLVQSGQRAPDRALAEPAPPGAVQTLRETEPPRVIGPAFDDDRSLPAHAKPVASYALTARLSEQDHVVAGKGTITWLNASSLPT